MVPKNAAVRPIILVKTVDQFTSVFPTIPKPLGLWRAFPMLTEHSIYAYSYDRNHLTLFANNIRRNGHLQPIASTNSAYVALFSEVKWKSPVWTGNMDSGSVIRKDPPLIFTYQGLKDGESYYLGWIKIDAAISEGGYPVQLPPQLQGAICIQDGSYVELYSDDLDFCRYLVSSGFYDLECTYSYVDVNLSIKTKLHCAPCPVCCGVHRDDQPCPFLSSPSINLDAVKHHFETIGDVIAREDLALSVIQFVAKEHFLLIQAPPCTGKTTLLKNIGLILLQRWPTIGLQYSEGQRVAAISPKIAHNTPPLHSPEDLMNQLSSNSRPSGPLWLLIDECQLTYTHRHWWDVLYRPPHYHPDLYVIAAGSFGSHSDSQSHSPPIDVPLSKRMPLFPGKVPNEKLFLAFTEQHLQEFLRGKNPAIDKNIIIEYASPVNKHDRMRFGVHPGVVTNLVRFLGNQVTKYPFKNRSELMDAFREDSEVVFNRPHPLDIERCLPRPLPTGFSPIWMLMFSTVLWHGYVEVPILARGIPEVVVQNSYGPLNASRTSPTFFGVIDLSHLLTPPVTDRDLACIAPTLRPGFQMTKKRKIDDTRGKRNRKTSSNTAPAVPPTPTRFIDVREFVLESHIACTPRQRFELYPENMSTVYSPGERSKPYSARQMVHASRLLTDFEQAAHDARQLGWLLELPSKSRPATHCKLVLPSQWHYDYLRKSLSPKVNKLADSITIDKFILLVLAEFDGSYLIDYLKKQGTIRERVYEMEFYRCAHRLAGACFMTPQARTADGSGYADFVVTSKRWIIEVACDGDRMKDHMGRVGDLGKYTLAWPDHEKRVVDFRVNKATRKVIKDEKYIAVQVLPPSKRQDTGPLRQHVQLTMHTSAGKTPVTLS